MSNDVRQKQIPRPINTDRAPSHGRVLAPLKREERCPSDVEHRQIKYRNDVIECHHGKPKRIIGATLRFTSMKTAYATVKGIEVMRALREGRAASFYFGHPLGKMRPVSRVLEMQASVTRPEACPSSCLQQCPGNRMAVQVLVVKESAYGERRVAATPETVKRLGALGAQVHVEPGAGAAAGFVDAAYLAAGAQLADAASPAHADLVLCVQPLPVAALNQLKSAAGVVGILQPQADPARAEAMRARQLVAFPLERLPRSTRAQAMDVLSSQAGMAGYKATLIAAQLAPRFFPMLTTAAGTIRPSKVLIVGAGVAGLQAIATAKRLGAQVEGFDVRPETREQIESLGGRFLDLGVSAAGEGGYARQLTDVERAEQQQRLADHLKSIDVVVCTAAVPGRPAPKILSAAMVEGMKPGGVVVDLAAETGGNCELTRPGETIDHGGVLVAGPLDLASMGAVHASEMYARNVCNFVALFLKDGVIVYDWDDELLAKTRWTG
ncbi:NAD(P)(+) transhydrogenase (Re/Si-specific) subunit alpha [Xanthomonas theicola]|uniref:proton-translocating NAD(P)(+) transhydrogenase n=2 Tax=Xanthomonas theicola TaxID=56464 RepID=A0A2S6ZEE5_9XANT|nr:NAD(P)(+) transhydrogenase (Re/Si-specific) subunit alpha [Xanthomonas theicola]